MCVCVYSSSSSSKLEDLIKHFKLVFHEILLVQSFIDFHSKSHIFSIAILLHETIKQSLTNQFTLMEFQHV